MSTLQQAITTRQNILTSIQGIPLDGLPNGPQLVSLLSQALRDSITADVDYEGWMVDFANYNYACGSDQTVDSEYVAAQAASQQATADKNAFIAVWNPMAPAYNQKTYSDTDI